MPLAVVAAEDDHVGPGVAFAVGGGLQDVLEELE